MPIKNRISVFHPVSKSGAVELSRVVGFFLMFMLLYACIFHQARAAPNGTVFLEEMTSSELQAEIRAGKTTIIIPIGGTEQNGPDMALGKHNIRVHILSGRIAAALGNAIVAPVIAYVPEGNIDPPTAHMRFAGTITIPEGTFEKVLESAAESFRHCGFRDIVFLGDHGGYQALDNRVAAHLNQAWGSSTARAHAIDEYYRVTQTEYVAALKRRGFTDSEIGTHAGLADTSLMMALDPSLVRAGRLQHDNPGVAQGVYGDPRRSSAALGEIGVDLIVNRTVAAIRSATSRR